jgi:hypothetical protein
MFALKGEKNIVKKGRMRKVMAPEALEYKGEAGAKRLFVAISDHLRLGLLA